MDGEHGPRAHPAQQPGHGNRGRPGTGPAHTEKKNTESPICPPGDHGRPAETPLERTGKRTGTADGRHPGQGRRASPAGTPAPSRALRLRPFGQPGRSSRADRPRRGPSGFSCTMSGHPLARARDPAWLPWRGPADSGGLPDPSAAHQPRAATWAMAMTFWLIPRTDGSLPSRRSTARIRFHCSGSPRRRAPCARSGLPQGGDAVVPARQVVQQYGIRAARGGLQGPRGRRGRCRPNSANTNRSSVRRRPDVTRSCSGPGPATGSRRPRWSAHVLLGSGGLDRGAGL